MALSGKDLDRIGDKFELVLEKRFTLHKEKDHDPIHARIGRLKTRIAYASGAAAVIVGVAQFAAKFFR
jgi:hypothetical protein